MSTIHPLRARRTPVYDMRNFIVVRRVIKEVVAFSYLPTDLFGGQQLMSGRAQDVIMRCGWEDDEEELRVITQWGMRLSGEKRRLCNHKLTIINKLANHFLLLPLRMHFTRCNNWNGNEWKDNKLCESHGELFLLYNLLSD